MHGVEAPLPSALQVALYPPCLSAEEDLVQGAHPALSLVKSLPTWTSQAFPPLPWPHCANTPGWVRGHLHHTSCHSAQAQRPAEAWPLEEGEIGSLGRVIPWGVEWGAEEGMEEFVGSWEG